MFLYILNMDKENMFKIGIATNIKRVKQHINTYENIIDLKESYIVNAKDDKTIRLLERQLLQDYNEYQIQNDKFTGLDGHTELRKIEILNDILEDIRYKASKLKNKQIKINKGIKLNKNISKKPKKVKKNNNKPKKEEKDYHKQNMFANALKDNFFIYNNRQFNVFQKDIEDFFKKIIQNNSNSVLEEYNNTRISMFCNVGNIGYNELLLINKILIYPELCETNNEMLLQINIYDLYEYLGCDYMDYPTIDILEEQVLSQLTKLHDMNININKMKIKLIENIEFTNDNLAIIINKDIYKYFKITSILKYVLDDAIRVNITKEQVKDLIKLVLKTNNVENTQDALQITKDYDYKYITIKSDEGEITKRDIQVLAELIKHPKLRKEYNKYALSDDLYNICKYLKYKNPTKDNEEEIESIIKKVGGITVDTYKYTHILIHTMCILTNINNNKNITITFDKKLCDHLNKLDILEEVLQEI